MKRRICNGYIIAVILFIAAKGDCYAQSGETLERERKSIVKEIEMANSLLEKTKNEKSSTEEQLNLVERKINLREEYVEKIKYELEINEEIINEHKLNIESLEKDLRDIKREYARFIRIAYQKRKKEVTLLYILASKDINQAYKRIKYLKQYSEYRNQQIELINAMEKVLDKKLEEMQKEKERKEEIIGRRMREVKLLSGDKLQKSSILKDLKKKEKDLRNEIREKERIAKRLEKEIRNIIEENAGNLYSKLTPEEKIVSNNFEDNIGRLPWPTSMGVVTKGFGEQEHALVKGIKVKNNGIDITTEPGTEVRSVFEGKVTKVMTIMGANYTVMIRHGSYLSVYHNLGEVFVKEGDNVSTKQNIGIVYSDLRAQNGTLHLEIWKEMENMNPEKWLSN